MNTTFGLCRAFRPPLGLAILAVFIGLLWGDGAQAQTRLAPGDDLAQAIRAAKPGDVLELAPGDYGVLEMTGGGGAEGGPLTLRSADPANPARLSGMDLREMSHLVLDGLVFDYTYQPTDKGNLRPFQVFTTRDLTIRNSLFDGDTAETDSPEEEAYPTGYGFAIRSSAGFTFENNEIREFYRGLIVSDVVDVVIRGNDIHAIRMDGSNFAQVERVLIERNNFHDFKRSVDSADHADMIQFWTNQTKRPSSDIVIRDNLLNSGLGWFTQSIFMRNEEVDRGRAGPEMFYRNVTIENNVIINAHLHGISVGETDGLVIRGNSVLRNARSEGKKKNVGLWTPQIRVSPAAVNVEISRNVFHKITGYENQPTWRVIDNFEVQDISPTDPGFYDQVFVAARTGNPQNLASFRYLPGGPLDGKGIGSDLLGGSGGTALAEIPNASAIKPAIRVTADAKFGNRFSFDIGTSAQLKGLETAAFSWDFGDGMAATGPTVVHSFGKPGSYNIALTLRMQDGTEMTSVTDLDVPGEDVLVFSAQTGTFVSYAAGQTPVIADIPPTNGPAELGKGNAVINIDRNLIAPFFDSSSFELKMRLKGKRSFKSAGELLRIHKTLVVSINERGMIDVRFDTVTDSKLRLYGGPVPFYSGEWVDLTLRYTADTGVFQVEANGKIISEGQSSGLIRPLEHWGLALGNPFNNSKSFEGSLDSLVLKVGTYDFASTQ